ncbi:hypothetical protein VUJ46_20100 [Chryseobacterium sp. MYb264]|uniref:hypothetical protein n=1 Tax=Chryseobacterium sp. MYb264 TaxID=2745153 RepID=UPI002E150209|nr:hypothetical protein VUJ46_20100 [Chryseobacterium sp. MYb264]
MKKIIKSKTIMVLTGFEKISESQGKQLLGGFSNTITNPTTGIDLDDGTTNNCQGGNCATNCSIHQNLNCRGACGK